MAIGTPFHPRTSVLNTSLNWRQWAGYFAAGCYHDFHQPEYAAIRNGAALIDVSPLYKYQVIGPDAEAYVDRLITRDARKLRVGQVVYTPWCDRHGKVLQEGTVLRLGEQHFQIHATDPALRWFELNAVGFDVRVEDRTAAVAVLAVQGPKSRDLLAQVVSGGDIRSLKFFCSAQGQIAGAPVLITRTGYTGDLGYELFIAADAAVRVWDALLLAGEGYGATACGLLALDIARIEAGFVLLGVDYISAEKALIPSQKSSPYEIGLGWSVKLDKSRDFNGRAALAAEAKAGCPPWQLVGLEIEWQPLEDLYAQAGLMPDLPTIAWRTAVPIYSGARQVGRGTSGCWSTLLKKYVILASVESSFAKPGTFVDLEVTVDYAHQRAPAQVVPLPFFRPPRLRE